MAASTLTENLTGRLEITRLKIPLDSFRKQRNQPDETQSGPGGAMIKSAYDET